MDAEKIAEAAAFDIELRLFIDAVYLRYHYDFRGYAQASLKRRLRAAMLHFGCATLTRLQERLLHEPAVFPRLLDYLTVQVSEMFRDPRYFHALRESVVPLLRTWPSLKVWVAGCSTGEEAYSLAILLREEGLLERTADMFDRRSILLAVTDAGRALLHELRTRKTAFLAERLETLEPGERATLERAADILERVLER